MNTEPQGQWMATRKGSRLHYFLNGRMRPICGAQTLGPITKEERDEMDRTLWGKNELLAWVNCRHCEIQL